MIKTKTTESFKILAAVTGFECSSDREQLLIELIMKNL